MPIMTTEIEAKRIVQKRSNAITRKGHHTSYVIGQKDMLTLDDEPFAAVTIKSIRPCTMAERTDGDDSEELAAGEGFTHVESWLANQRSIYGSVGESLIRITFDVERLM